MIGFLSFLQIVLCVGGISKGALATVVVSETLSVSTAGCFFSWTKFHFSFWLCLILEGQSVTVGKICFSVYFKQTGLIRFDRHTDMCTHICITDFRMLLKPLTVSADPTLGVLVFWYQIHVKRAFTFPWQALFWEYVSCCSNVIC